MDSKKSDNLSEKSELKTFMANIRSGNLVRLIESNQLQFEEKCTYLTQKLKKSEQEMRRKVLILQQNSQIIEKFQKQLQELSDQNAELLDQQQVLKEENENLNAQLQCSEDKFAQLDILYDQQVYDLSERKSELEQHLAKLESSQEQCIGQLDQTQRDFNDMLTKAEQRNVDLLNELTNLQIQKETENEHLKKKLAELTEVLNQKTIDYEERIQDLQTSLSSALDVNRERYDLEIQIEKLNNGRKADQKTFDIEKSSAISENEELKLVVDDLKKKLCTKEKEVEELYLKLKQITRLGNSTSTGLNSFHPGNFSSRKHASPDDPQPIDNSSDSEGSSVSFYKGKFRRISTDPDDEDMENQRKPSLQKNQFRTPTFGYRHKKPKIFDHIEIPESPIVSSSAFGQNEQKF